MTRLSTCNSPPLSITSRRKCLQLIIQKGATYIHIKMRLGIFQTDKSIAMIRTSKEEFCAIRSKEFVEDIFVNSMKALENQSFYSFT